VFVQCFAQRGNLSDQIVLLNHRVRPDLSKQFVFLHHLPALPQQKQQQLESLQAERHDLAVAQQNGLFRVRQEGAELVETCIVFLLQRFHRFSGFFQAGGITFQEKFSPIAGTFHLTASNSVAA